MKWTGVFHLLLCCLTHCLAARQSSTPNLDCDFDNGLCEWEDTSVRYHEWELKSGPASLYKDTGPSGDHTSGRGNYLLLNSDNSGSQKLRIRSPRIRTSRDACLSFWYMMHGYDVKSLWVKNIRNGMVRKGNEIFTKFGPQGKRWYHGLVTVPSGDNRLEIEAEYSGWSNLGHIAIDDISFSYEGRCTYDADLLKNQPRFNCDFEDDLCSWYSVEEKGTIWARKTIDDDSNDRNALSPLTNGTSYAHIEGSPRGSYYVISNLRGPTISVGEKGACMTFWYKKFLNLVDKLMVVKHGYGQGKYGAGGYELFSTSKENGLVWEQAQVTLPEGDNFNIVIRAMGFYHFKGTVAIDDVSLSDDGPCPEEKRESKINCDFDTNFCKWYMTSSKDAYDWERGRGPTPSPDTGPDKDHTKGDGYYVYLDSSKVDEAKLYSPFMDGPSSCLSFWYYMHGKDVAILTLNLYEFGFDENKFEFLNRTKTLWSIEGERGAKWIQHNISLPSLKDTALGFEAVRGYFPRGDIAIDDISISFGGPCEKDRTTTTTTTTTSTTTSKGMVKVTTTEKPKLPTPKLLVNGKVDPAYENTRVELICDGEKSGTQYKWYSRLLDSKTTTVEDNSQRKFVFNEIQLSQAGTYWCEISKINHLTSDVSNEVHVAVVHDPRPVPEITTEGLMEAEPAQVNHLIKLMCGHSVDGARYHWETSSTAFRGSELPNNQTLLLHARPEHSGSYSCHVTKDGFSTASSAKFNLSVTPGRRCTSDDSCDGQAYISKCNDLRCECGADAVVRDNSCELRPKQPQIHTSPAFLEFAFGETIYLICEAQLPVPSTAVYSFRRDGEPLSRENEVQTSNVLKITSAGEGNGGNYDCFVTHRDIDSFHSKSISIKIKDFTDLSCNFGKDLCEWSTQTGPGYVDVAVTKERDPESSRPRMYIRVQKQGTTETVKAVLKSPIIKRTSLDSCLTLWYRMHGPEVYSLTVWTYTFSRTWQENKGERLWTTVGEHGKRWIQERITIPAGDEFYIALEMLGTVDLDDIVFTYRGSCQE